MRLRIKESPQEIERKFNQICRDINRFILREDSQIPPQDLFQQLDDEFENVKKKYKEQNDEVNLLHATHNYLWRKSFQFIQDAPTQSLKLIIKAISILLKRHALREYNNDILERMLGTYEVALIKISEKGESIDFNTIESEIKEFLNFYVSYVSENPMSSERLPTIINTLIHCFVKNHLDKKVNTLKITYSNIRETEALASEIKLILDILEIISTEKSYLPSECYEILYKLRKKQLHFLVRFIYFERVEEKKQNAQKIIDQITEEFVNYSQRSIKGAQKFIRNLPTEKQDEDSIKLMITLKEVDKLTAEYYKEAYSNKDILKAWTVMDKIKSFLVMKAFKENVPLSDSLLRYYGEEWALLYIFAKICLLKMEVAKRGGLLSQKWEREVFEQITKSLQIAERLFKYEMTDTKDYTLKIMTSSFAGNFSEYFIYELCQEFFECGLIDDKTPSDFRDLLECIKLVRKEDIKLNDVLEKGKPDIDIHIKNKCAIFLKNAKIESNEMKKIWGEINLCNKNGIHKIFYCINFIKNIEKIEYVRKSFEKIKKYYVDLNLEVFDIKDVVNVLLAELKRSGKSKLNFSELDLYRVLDY